MAHVPQPFRLAVPDAALADLKERLARTRWPDEPPLEPWSTGTSLAYLQGLVRYWQEGFDWRAAMGYAEFPKEILIPARSSSPKRWRAK